MRPFARTTGLTAKGSQPIKPPRRVTRGLDPIHITSCEAICLCVCEHCAVRCSVMLPDDTGETGATDQGTLPVAENRERDEHCGMNDLWSRVRLPPAQGPQGDGGDRCRGVSRVRSGMLTPVFRPDEHHVTWLVSW
jgi:hypothetical protein